MMIIPAIDIKNGKCVRLKQGDAENETVFSDHPEDMARKWFTQGAERIHIVDLDGAFRGEPVNSEIIRKITKSVPVPIQLGGGVRDIKTLRAYVDMGIHYVILGTAAHKDPGFLKEACKLYPKRIILGIDSRDGHVAVEGWVEQTQVSATDLAKRFENQKISAIIHTDIRRDGMKSGPNLSATKELAMSTSIPVIASGGITDISDVKSVVALGTYGVGGLITGRALYDGSLNLQAAIKLAKKHAFKF